MRAVFVDEPYKVSVHNVDLPEYGDDDVLIRVVCCGVCGSDLHAYRGKHAFRIPPVMLGHEMAGIVEAVGKNVSEYKAGQAVTVMPQISCGECEDCRSNKANLCKEKILPSMEGWKKLGCFADYFVAPAKVVCPLGDVDTRLGALSEPLAVGVHLLERIPKDHNEDLVIIGAGTIGMMVLMAAQEYGFHKILITDIEDYNLTLAKELGATAAVNVSREDLLEKVHEYFGASGCKNIAVAAGGPDILNQAVDIAAPGANIMFTAMITAPSNFFSYPIVYKELNFLGSFNYVMDNFKTSVELLKKHGDKFSRIVTHTFKLDNAAEAFTLFDKKTEPCVKILLEVD